MGCYRYPRFVLVECNNKVKRLRARSEGQNWHYNLKSYFFNMTWIKVVLPFGNDPTETLGMEWHK